MVGGFDIRNRRPKPTYYAVPQGSVYYFELIEGKIEDVIEKIHGKSISEKYSEQGFGISFVGGVFE